MGGGGGVRLTSLYDARLQDGAFNQSAPDIVIATCPNPSFSTGIGAGLGVGFPGRSSVGGRPRFRPCSWSSAVSESERERERQRERERVVFVCVCVFVW